MTTTPFFARHRTYIASCWADKTSTLGSSLTAYQYPADASGNYWVGRQPFFDMCPVQLQYGNGACTIPSSRTA